MVKWISLAGLFALGIVTAGCGGRDPNLPDLVPVAGVVTLDGKPVSAASVWFVPTGSTRGGGSTGYTDEKGQYELKAQHGGSGAPVGQYQVVISKMVMPDGSPYSAESGVAPMDSPARELLPERYCSETDSTLKATVPDGGSSSIDFTLTSEP